MHVLRTPERRFEKVPDFPFEPHYLEVASPRGGNLRVHYVDEGPRDRPPVLLLHGLPTWSYLYRKIIPVLANAGFRVVAPDLVGFGRSDKPSERTDYTLAGHIGWLGDVVAQLALSDVTLFCHDWGGPVGLGVLASEPERFARVLACNTILHTGEAELAGRLGEGYSAHLINDNEVAMGVRLLQWLAGSQRIPDFAPSVGLERMCDELSGQKGVLAAYDAPFPDESYKAGVRQFPLLNPFSPNDRNRRINLQTWDVLRSFDRPLLTAYSDSDPSTGGWDGIFQERVPGAAGQPHVTFEGAGHFVQEERPEELSRLTLDFIRRT